MLSSQLVQILPRIDAGIVRIVEQQPDRVVAYGFDANDADIALAGHSPLLVWSMALHLGARALHAQVLGGQCECRAIVERYMQHLPRLVEPDFRWQRHHSSSLRASSGS